MSSSDYTTTCDCNHITGDYCQSPARPRHRAAPAYWVDISDARLSVKEKEGEGAYCALCDRLFESMKRRELHIARSSRHPYCEVCDRRFLNGNALRAHLEYSYDHHWKADGSWRRDFDRADELSHRDMVWETYNEFDFDDTECVGDEIHECIAHLVKQPEEEEPEAENESGPPARDFTCPICEHAPKTVCSTICGHLFCAPCIKLAYDISGSCPVCDEEGNVKQLRKMYISA